MNKREKFYREIGIEESFGRYAAILLLLFFGLIVLIIYGESLVVLKKFLEIIFGESLV